MSTPANLSTIPARLRAILAELDRAANEYTEALSDFESARIRYEAARERFASVRRIANDVLGFSDWFDWRWKNKSVLYAALDVGDAIKEALRARALDMALDCSSDSGRQFDPSMTLDEIHDALESGGFEFKSTAGRREVNAALMKLNGVTKIEATGKYEIQDANDIYTMICGHERAEA